MAAPDTALTGLSLLALRVCEALLANQGSIRIVVAYFSYACIYNSTQLLIIAMEINEDVKMVGSEDAIGAPGSIMPQNARGIKGKKLA
jgi:hypothetical protein